MRRLAIALAVCLLLAFSMLLDNASESRPNLSRQVKNAYYPFTVETSIKDRPVLETVPQVRKARMTGISEFDFDGVHYVIDGLPEEYIDYASEYCRMP